MELSFNDKIIGKLQNYHFKLNWICLPVKNYCVTDNKTFERLFSLSFDLLF